MTVGGLGVRRVIGQHVSRRLRCRARPCVACRQRVPCQPGGTPSRVFAAPLAHQGQDHGSRSSEGAYPPHILSRGGLGGGMCAQSQRVMARWWENPELLACAPSIGGAPPPPLLCSPSGVRGTVHQSPGHCCGQTPACRPQPPRPLVQSALGSALTRASALGEAGSAGFLGR